MEGVTDVVVRGFGVTLNSLDADATVKALVQPWGGLQRPRGDGGRPRRRLRGAHRVRPDTARRGGHRDRAAGVRTIRGGATAPQLEVPGHHGWISRDLLHALPERSQPGEGRRRRRAVAGLPDGFHVLVRSLDRRAQRRREPPVDGARFGVGASVAGHPHPSVVIRCHQGDGEHARRPPRAGHGRGRGHDIRRGAARASPPGSSSLPCCG